MTILDAQMAAYEDAISIAKATADEFGPMPAAACLAVAARIQTRMEQVLEAMDAREAVPA